MSGRQGVSFTLKQALISSTDMSVPCNLTQVTQHVPYTQPVTFSSISSKRSTPSTHTPQHIHSTHTLYVHTTHTANIPYHIYTQKTYITHKHIHTHTSTQSLPLPYLVRGLCLLCSLLCPLGWASKQLHKCSINLPSINVINVIPR